jgi:peptidoglycan/xylan/chitin deacetylase (PgdA/CDA1 family)
MTKRTLKERLVLLVMGIFLILCLILYVYIPYQQEHIQSIRAQQSAIDGTKLVQKQRTLLMEQRQMTPLKLPILLYHYVENVTDQKDTIRKSLNIPPSVFEAQVVTLLTNGYKPILLDDVTNYFSGNQVLPDKPVVLTFDDGYRDFYTDVLPILRKYHVPATLYMVSGFRDTTKNYLTTQQLLEISRSGLVEIGAHTVHHPKLTLLPISEAEAEIVKSKQELEQLLSRPVLHFAYPYGAYSPELVNFVNMQSGFLTAATVDKGTVQSYASRFILKRIRPGQNTGVVFLQEMRQQ